jgi:hypothetical protein
VPGSSRFTDPRLLTGAVALGVAELTAAITGPRGTPVVAAGETAINLTPVAVKDFAIAHFGSHDKEALIIGIVVLLVGFAALIGMLAVAGSLTDWPGSPYSRHRRRGGRSPSECQRRRRDAPVVLRMT